MNLKERLRSGLEHSRWFTDKVLGEITDPSDWVRRPVPGTNHALWIAGHLGIATNAFVGFVDASKTDPRDDFGPLFGKGSQPLDDLALYPKPEEVTSYLTQRGETFIGLLDACDDADFARRGFARSSVHERRWSRHSDGRLARGASRRSTDGDPSHDRPVSDC